MLAGLSLGVFTSRNLANCLWALAKMSHNPGQIFLDAMVVEVGKKLEGCNAQNLVCLLPRLYDILLPCHVSQLGMLLGYCKDLC